MTYGEALDHLSGMLSGADLDDIEGTDLIFERAANTMLSKIRPLETIRVAGLVSTVHDDFFNYALPSDFGEIIDLYPQDDRNRRDVAVRPQAQMFDLKKMLLEKQISIEGVDGSKVARINWKSRSGKVLNTLDSLTANGTWSAVGSASGLAADSIYKVSGGSSVKFTHVVSGDGIQNTTMTAVDLTEENGVADVFVPIFFSTVPTSVTAIWGNNLTTKFWTGVAQTTQADGTAFRVGWNIVKFAWSAATQTGTVAPATINSFKITAAGTALSTMRVDNIIFSIGRNFDMKYYSKYIFKSAAGTYMKRPTDSSDIVTCDTDSMQIFLMELLIAAAQEIESSNAAGNISFAQGELYGHPNSPDRNHRVGLYTKFEKKYPKQVIKTQKSYGSSNFSRGRW